MTWPVIAAFAAVAYTCVGVGAGVKKAVTWGEQ